MNKTIRSIVSGITCLALLVGSGPLHSQTAPANLCAREGTVIAFFNGVRNTPLQARAVLEELARLHGETSPSGESIRYELMYNYSTGPKGLDDLVETFDQRTKEQNGLLADRFELFFEVVHGGGRWGDSITREVLVLLPTYDELKQAALASAISYLATLATNPPTTLTYQEHRLRIDNLILEGKKLLFVAHSQGNLFVNPAYDYARARMPGNALTVVHLAPASATTRGPHILADLDLVINGLRLGGRSVKDVTDLIPPYSLRPAGADDQKDKSGHGMWAIYINQRLDIGTKSRQLINDALTRLVAPPAQGSTGFFSATLTWDGAGDVDLHVYEPDGTHVMWSARSGNSGYLDVDNRTADGPEHYYATCTAASLQVGYYQVRVANYSGAYDRIATVQIATDAEGVLGTRSVRLGASTGSSPSATLFTVYVARQPSGKYTAQIIN